MRNARIEFIEQVGSNEVKCATITYGEEYWDDPKKQTYFLPVGYSAAQYDAFLSWLEFNYDPGYGGQELFGTIWYMDGDWSERGEYDGSEWWEYKTCPEIPDSLKGAA